MTQNTSGGKRIAFMKVSKLKKMCKFLPHSWTCCWVFFWHTTTGLEIISFDYQAQNLIDTHLIFYFFVQQIKQYMSVSITCHGAGGVDSSFKQSHFNTSTGLCPAAPTFRERKQSFSLPQCSPVIKRCSPICFCNQLRNHKRCNCAAKTYGRHDNSESVKAFIYNRIKNRSSYHLTWQILKLWGNTFSVEGCEDTKRQRQILKVILKNSREERVEKALMQWLNSTTHTSISSAFSPLKRLFFRLSLHQVFLSLSIPLV